MPPKKKKKRPQTAPQLSAEERPGIAAKGERHQRGIRADKIKKIERAEAAIEAGKEQPRKVATLLDLEKEKIKKEEPKKEREIAVEQKVEQKKVLEREGQKEGAISKGIKGTGKILAGLPLVGGAFKGAERLSLETLKIGSKALEALGGAGFSAEQIEGARTALGLGAGNVLKDPDVQSLALTAGGALVGGAIISKIAPRMATLLGTGRTAVITRTATITKGNFGATLQKTTQRVFTVSPGVQTNLAQRMAAMDKVTIRNIVRGGVGFVWRNKKTVVALTGAQSLMIWYGADNIMQGASIFSRDLATNVRFGNLTKGEALEGLEEAERDVAYARRFIKTMVLINPLIWPFYRILNTGAIGVQRSIDLQRTLLEREQ